VRSSIVQIAGQSRGFPLDKPLQMGAAAYLGQIPRTPAHSGHLIFTIDPQF
jgi:hypothetical protein